MKLEEMDEAEQELIKASKRVVDKVYITKVELMLAIQICLQKEIAYIQYEKQNRKERSQ
jgi:hypothetical protein